MDHNFLNRIRELTKSTAENIAQLLFKRLSKKTPSGEYLAYVEIEETPGCSVRYTDAAWKQKAGEVEPVICTDLRRG